MYQIHNRRIRIGLFLVLSVPLAGCTSPDNLNVKDVNKAIQPYRFGMKIDEIPSVYHHHKRLEMISSANLSRAVTVRLASGVGASAIFDSDERLCRVRVQDRSFRIGSLGPNATYGEIRSAFPASESRRLRGYAWEVRASVNIMFCFPPEEILADELRADWVDLLPAS
jgi:hypothetical protein